MIKKSIISLRTNFNLRKPTILEARSFDQARSIGLIINNLGGEADTINEFITSLEGEGKIVHTLSLDSDETKSLKNKGLGKGVTSRDFSIMGSIISPTIETFVSREYDFLLVMENSQHYLTRYIASMCKASFKVGLTEDQVRNQFNMVIRPQSGREFEDVLKYVKKINFD